MHKLFLTLASSVFRAGDFAGGEISTGIEPAAEVGAAGERRGFAREIDEDALGGIMGQVSIAGNLAESDGINEIDVPADQFGEGFFGTSLGVVAKQFVVRLHSHFIAPAGRKNRTIKLSECAWWQRNRLVLLRKIDVGKFRFDTQGKLRQRDEEQSARIPLP